MKTFFNLRSFVPIAALACAFLPGLAKAQSYPPVWSNTGAYAAGDMVTDYGNVYRCIKAVTTHYLDPSKTYQNWEIYYVRNNTTLVIGVGQTFPTLTAAWTYAENCHIAEGVYLHLSISTTTANLNENLGNGINLDQPSGASISIIGDNENNINFTSSNGIQLDTGHSIGLISGITLTGSDSLTGSGIDIIGNATIGALTGIIIQGSHTLIFADQGARVHCTSSVQLSGFYYAVYALEEGSVVFDSGASILQGIGGVALDATLGGYISAPGMTIQSCTLGVSASEGGIVNVASAIFQQNYNSIIVSTKGHVDANTAMFGTGGNANTSTDITVQSGGTVDANSATTYTSSIGSNDGSYIY